MTSSEMNAEKLFWELVEPMYADPAVTRSTMMGFPCVRVDGKFFASLDRRNGHLVVKLPAERVTELVESRRGLEFAPNGRVFREWAAIETLDEAEWGSLLKEARRFVAGLARER